jgi:hypothetical protein
MIFSRIGERLEVLAARLAASMAFRKISVLIRNRIKIKRNKILSLQSNEKQKKINFSQEFFCVFEKNQYTAEDF